MAFGTPDVDGSGIGMPGSHEEVMSGGMICKPTEGVRWVGVDASANNRDSSSARTNCSSSSFALENSWLRSVTSEADTANARARSPSSSSSTGFGG